MAFRNKIPRLEKLSISDFKRHFLAKSKPVIIRNLYKNQKILKLTSRQKLIKTLGDVEIGIGQNYYESAGKRHSISDENYTCTVDEYFRLIKGEPNLSLLLREMPAPTILTNMINEPKISKINPYSHSTSFMYMARGGLVAPMHYDGDHREVLFTQLLGKKRIFLLPPSSSPQMYPIRNASGYAFMKMPENKRCAILEALGAQSCILAPGETLFIPSLWWHYLENIGTTFAFNVRFEISPYLKRLRTLPIHYMIQLAADLLINKQTYKPTNKSIYYKLLTTYYRRYGSREERLLATIDMAHQAIRKLRPKIDLNLWVGSIWNSEESEYRKWIKADREFCNPTIYSRGSPFDSSSTLEKSLLRKKARDRLKIAESLFLRSYGLDENLQNLTKLDWSILMTELDFYPKVSTT